jgi:hypothetical protein
MFYIQIEQLIMPQFINYPVNTHHQKSTEEINQKNKEDENDRHLVCSLPD